MMVMLNHAHALLQYPAYKCDKAKRNLFWEIPIFFILQLSFKAFVYYIS
jgi:hypothetical protein